MTRWRRVSLRWRVAAAFGLGLLVLVSALAAATWKLSTGYMLSQREQSATWQAEVNVRLVDEALRAGSGGLDELLTGFSTGPDSTILLFQSGRWLTSGRQVEPSALPAALVAEARKGRALRQRVRVGGIPVLAVALPVATARGFYVELFPLTELDRTFKFLSSLLIGGTLACVVLAAVLGWWTSRRALRPLIALTAAASRVAAGDLTARLPDQADPDLAPLATTFNATAQALEQRVGRDARFAGDVSHELRSPLTTMVNAAEVLERRRGGLPPTAGQALDLLLAEVHRFHRMVLDLLEISRAHEEDDARSRELVDLAELVRHVVDRASAALPIDVDLPPPLVWADRRRLDRVVANLLDNAERYGDGPVRVAVARRDSRVRIEVDDAGPGVPPELRERIFERFARGEHAGRRGASTGSGLGLAIVAEHVRRDDGIVWVEDRPGGGARFVVELPEAKT
ncbi:HAMP domain-containing sensor histidine kinase [Amycolatopsis sp.]|uniref:sensor histidine kinase n=1 Tax=Amycolatopsis sp. TaxID=37632 RepID=UPI002D0E375C|nr:HAMP domain-containing sensor histidine kinase [Amycolatopsis sp.]HVV12041.1 HAMP domain-containing sensor histidine kinase [Amycolatopsis sp.]